MKLQIAGVNGRPILVSLILLGCSGFVLVLCFDLLYSQYGLLGEAWPDFSGRHLLRSAVILLSVILMALGLTGGWPRVTQPLDRHDDRVERLVTLAALCVSGFVVLLFVIKPDLFNEWSLEDGPIEWGSAVLLLAACAVLLFTLAKGRMQGRISRLTGGLLAILAVVFFVIAMEEVSWLQRVLDLKVPESLGSNEQGELNFHNLATNRIENLYYFGAFIFLVVLPVLRVLFPTAFAYAHIAPLAPGRFVAVIEALCCAYNFDMWNIIFTQIAFFGAVVALALLVVLSSDRATRGVIVCALLLVLATQVVFLGRGDDFSRMWEVTEYKEFFIPLGFFAYSIGVCRNTSGVRAP